MPLDLGRLDRRVTFQAPAETGRDDRNEPIVEWFDVCTVLARRDHVRDVERNQGAGVNREVSHRFVTHWTSMLEGLTGVEQMVDAGVIYAIVDRKVLGRGEGIEWSAIARPDLTA